MKALQHKKNYRSQFNYFSSLFFRFFILIFERHFAIIILF